MSVLHPSPVSTKQFSYDAAKRNFVGEISATNGFGRVYDDACDEGLTLVSHLTGKEVVFAVTDVQRDGEGDVQFWTLGSVGREALTITLFND